MHENPQSTAWKLYTDNIETMTAMINACEKAVKSIDLEQFIFVPDDFGNKLIEVCTRKAQQGVKVRFIWDAAGSFNFFASDIVDDLKNRGIELVFFKTLFPRFFEFHKYQSWYFRNHRRTLVIDGETAFTGSICIDGKMKDWRDTNIMIQGLVVNDINRAFERMWLRAHNRKLIKIKFELSSEYEFRYISNTPIPRHRRLYKNIIDSIRNAEKSIYITTPYFVPTHHLARVIRLAAHRGVDVRILMPEWSDNRFVDLCSRTFFHNILKSGAKIYLYKNRMLHSKTIIIDNSIASIGTMNMDHVSLLYNFEANIVSTNTEFATELTGQFWKDIENSEEVTFDNWSNRYWVEKFAGFFLRFVRVFF